MRRLRVALRPEALADLDDVFRIVLRASQHVPTAKAFVRRIRDRCARIGDAPSGDRARDDFKPGLRVVPFERTAVIAYEVGSDRVLITNVFYGGRDFEALYRAHDPEDDA